MLRKHLRIPATAHLIDAAGLLLASIVTAALFSGCGDSPEVDTPTVGENQPGASGTETPPDGAGEASTPEETGTSASEQDQEAADSPGRPAKAPPDAISWNENWYWFSAGPASINDALQLAVDTGGRLMVVSSAEENAFAAQHLKGKTYLGLFKLAGTDWLNNLRQRQAYFNWGASVPSSQTADALALMLPGGQWTASAFDDTANFVALEWGDEAPVETSVSPTNVSPGLARCDLWRQSDGDALYRKTDSGWLMKNGTREVKLVETKRTEEYVELHEADRDVTRRLYADHAAFARLDVSKKWTVLHPGGWRDSSKASAAGGVTQQQPTMPAPGTVGTIPPPVSISPGEGFALRFNGRHHVELQNTRGLADIGKSFTAEMWFRSEPFDPTRGFTNRFISTWAQAPTSPEVGQGAAGWFVKASVTPMGPAGTARRLTYFFVLASQDGKTHNHYYRCSESRQPEWQHLAVCSETTADGWSASLYVDGQRRLANKSSASIASTRPSPRNLWLGFTPDHTNDADLRGLIRAFRLSSTVRYREQFTPPQVFQRDSNTLVLSDFSRPTGNLIADLSGNNRHGTIAGAQWVALRASNAPVVASRPPTHPKPVLPVPAKSKPVVKTAVRLKVPAEDEQKKSLDEVKEILGDQFDRARTPQAKVELAKMLLKTCEEEENPATIYVVLMQARDLTADAGDMDTALRAVNDLDRRFEIDLLSMKADTLKQLSSNVRDPRVRRSLAETAMDVGNQSAAADQYRTADSMLTMAISLARNIKDTDLMRTAQIRNREVDVEQKRWQAAESARKTLDDASDDPEANSALGKYLCFGKGNWTDGVKHLAKSSDAALASVAKLDAQGPTDGKERVSVADAWFSWAEKAKDYEQNGAYLRAQHWYETARPTLSGFMKAKVGKRLEELAEKATPISGSATGGTKRFAWLDGSVGELRRLAGHTDTVLDLSVSSSGRRAATSGEDGTIIVWDLATGQPLNLITTGASYCYAVAISPNEQFVVGNLQRDKLGVWNAQTGSLTGQIPTRYQASVIAFSPDGRRLVWGVRYSSTTRPNVGISDISANRALGQLRTDGYPSAIAFSPDGRLIATASTGASGTTDVWSLAQGTAVQRLTGHGSSVSDIAFSPDGRLVASASPNAVIIWNVTSGQEVRRISTNSPRACLDFSPDGHRLVTGGGFYGEIQLWNVEDGTSVQQLSPSGPRASGNYTQKVAYLPDPRGIVSAHYDGSIRLWRVPD